MIEGKTSTGFEFSVDERINDDWRIIDAIVDSESEDASVKLKATKTLVDLVLGKDKERMIKHIADNNDGVCPSDAVLNEVTEIFNAIKELKN